MKIDPAAARCFAFDHAFRRVPGRRAHQEIDVAIRSERWLWIQTGNGPALEENRLDACGAHEPKDFLDFGLVNVGLERQEPKGLVQQFSGCSVAQTGFADLPPAQTRRA